MENTHDDYLLKREFTWMYVEYGPRLIKVAMRYVRDLEVARDIVSDSYASVWSRIDSLPKDVNKPAYLTAVVRNNCVNYLKAQQNLSGYVLVQSGLVAENLRALEAFDPEVIFTDEVRELIRTSLAHMPQDTRTIYELSRYEDKTYQEIAQQLGISVRKVTSEIQKALVILRAGLKDYLPVTIFFILFSRF